MLRASLQASQNWQLLFGSNFSSLFSRPKSKLNPIKTLISPIKRLGLSFYLKKSFCKNLMRFLRLYYYWCLMSSKKLGKPVSLLMNYWCKIYRKLTKKKQLILVKWCLCLKKCCQKKSPHQRLKAHWGGWNLCYRTTMTRFCLK